MPATGETIRLEGFRELQRAMALADRETKRRFQQTLRDVAEPVRSDAERLAASSIRRIGLPWSRMRVGITQHSVYVAPAERGRLGRRNPRLKRKNLAPLLMGRAMLPALRENEPGTVAAVERMLTGVALDWERV